MLRRPFIILLACLGLGFVHPAVANDSEQAAADLISKLIIDVEKMLEMDTGDLDQRRAAVDSLLDGYFDMDSITRFSAGQYWRAATDAEKTEYQGLFREVLVGTIVRNFDQLNGLDYEAGGTTPKGDKFVIVSGTFSDGREERPPVAVNWRVLTRAGHPVRVFDIEIENLSLLVTQKQENVAVIRKNKGAFAALIKIMRERVTGGDATSG